MKQDTISNIIGYASKSVVLLTVSALIYHIKFQLLGGTENLLVWGIWMGMLIEFAATLTGLIMLTLSAIMLLIVSEKACILDRDKEKFRDNIKNVSYVKNIFWYCVSVFRVSLLAYLGWVASTVMGSVIILLGLSSMIIGHYVVSKCKKLVAEYDTCHSCKDGCDCDSHGVGCLCNPEK